jgi:hypothetical protein
MGESMNHKMINLCDETLKIANNMGNFSKWVRAELIKIAPKPSKEYLHRSCDTFITIEYDTHHQNWQGWCPTCEINLELKER